MEEITREDVEKKAIALPQQVRTIIVKDKTTLERANRALHYIKGLQAEINRVFDPIIRKAHEAHKEALVQKKQAERPIVQAEQYVKKQISDYMAELQRQRLEVERKERERQEALRKAEEEKLLRAIEAEEAGKKEEANKILDEPNPEPPVIAPPPLKPKLDGTYTREIWKWEIVDYNAIPHDFLMVDQRKINDVVRKMKNKTEIPGIRVYSEQSVSTRLI